jgi:hypothetical protein
MHKFSLISLILGITACLARGFSTPPGNLHDGFLLVGGFFAGVALLEAIRGEK